eukprot:jgi/Botrbrau1/14936/Bobra.0018s0040.1
MFLEGINITACQTGQCYSASSQLSALSLILSRALSSCQARGHQTAAAAFAEPLPAIVEIYPEDSTASLTPRQVVEQLDRHIIGQADAKKAVANALRNRWRRQRVPSPMKEEIVPKNILMIGPTGCGKTEIARRLAKLVDAPFVKVEATKFTEVGFHGRDVDMIIRDLADNAIVMMREKMRRNLKPVIMQAVEDKIMSILCGPNADPTSMESFRRMYRMRDMETRTLEIDVPAGRPSLNVMDNQSGMAVQEMIIRVDKLLGNRGRSEKRKVTVAEARDIVEEMETERLINNDTVQREAIQAVEQDGIVFIDEIDKITVNHQSSRYGADASSEGVQRDLLPIIEGSVVNTKYGNVNTDHILFICSGAFHSCKPADMLAELQGRLPVRVELKGLTKEDFYRILTEPENNMIRQQQMLLETEGVELHFTEEAIQEIARVAEEVNRNVDNIGARRLHTVIERIVDDISFSAPEKAAEAKEGGDGTCQHWVHKEDVIAKLGDLLKRQDLSKYIL